MDERESLDQFKRRMATVHEFHFPRDVLFRLIARAFFDGQTLGLVPNQARAEIYARTILTDICSDDPSKAP